MWHTYMTCQMSDVRQQKWITVEIKMGKTQRDMQIYARTHVVKKLSTLIIFKRYQYPPRGGCTQTSKKNSHPLFVNVIASHTVPTTSWRSGVASASP